MTPTPISASLLPEGTRWPPLNYSLPYPYPYQTELTLGAAATPPNSRDSIGAEGGVVTSGR
eukprot:758125-Hanusia_phi.AAC.1